MTGEKRAFPMVAGRELDAIVAVQVLGLKVESRGLRAERNSDDSMWVEVPRLVVLRPSHAPNAPGGSRRENLRDYSTNIAAAWEVVPAMVAKGWRLDLRVDDDGAEAFFDNFSVYFTAVVEAVREWEATDDEDDVAGVAALVGLLDALSTYDASRSRTPSTTTTEKKDG